MPGTAPAALSHRSKQPESPAMELHVWGPAFDLPSGDPESLAAIAYIGHVLPRHTWVLVQGGIDATGELPVLHDGKEKVRGFEPIVKYLRQKSDGEVDLDKAYTSRASGLTPLQRADCLAFSTFLTTAARPLLDLFLYLSHKNYTHAIRPAYTSTLSFPYTWIIPSHRRAVAKHRTSHLGVSSIDLDPTDPSHNLEVEGIRIKALGRKSSISATLQAPETANRIRLEALTQAVLGPLNELYKSSPGAHLLVEEPTSLDCLALGYLALFAIPDLPVPFLATALQKYPELMEYTRRGMHESFNIPAQSTQNPPTANAKTKRSRKKTETVERADDERKNLELSDSDTSDSEGVDLANYDNMAIGADPSSTSSTPSELPYLTQTAPPPSPLDRLRGALYAVLPDVPLLRPDPILPEGRAENWEDADGHTPIPTTLLTLGAGAAVLAGGMIYTGIGGVGRSGRGKVDLGEAGAMLGLGSAEVPLSG